MEICYLPGIDKISRASDARLGHWDDCILHHWSGLMFLALEPNPTGLCVKYSSRSLRRVASPLGSEEKKLKNFTGVRLTGDGLAAGAGAVVT